MDEKRVTDSEYLTIGEAAEYLGVSPQTLRRWDASGKLRPVRHPASEYRYYRRTDLEPFRLAYRRAMQEASADHLFQTAEARIADNDLLRDPQREAHAKVQTYFTTH